MNPSFIVKQGYEVAKQGKNKVAKILTHLFCSQLMSQNDASEVNV